MAYHHIEVDSVGFVSVVAFALADPCLSQHLLEAGVFVQACADEACRFRTELACSTAMAEASIAVIGVVGAATEVAAIGAWILRVAAACTVGQRVLAATVRSAFSRATAVSAIVSGELEVTGAWRRQRHP